MTDLLRIATRQSPLALWQARHVASLLQAAHPGLRVEILELSTAGDRFLAASLAAVGGKGLFVKEIEAALLDGRADLAVHSLKDMTSVLPEGLLLAAVPEREDPRDALVSPSGRTLEALPFRARVGTSSQRRSCILRERRADLDIVSVRGNVQTRLGKLEEAKLDAIVLALAGLRRLGLEHLVTQVLSTDVSLPAVGQGVLAVECREDDVRTRGLLAALEHVQTRQAVVAERAFLAALEGGCTVPMAGFAEIEGDTIRMRGMVGAPDGSRVVRGERRGNVADGARLGRELAEELLSNGAREILDAHAHSYARGSDSAKVPDAAYASTSSTTQPEPVARSGRLEGERVWVTRPRERAEALCFLLEDEGAEVISLPLLDLHPPMDERPLLAAAAHVQRYRWVLFTSPSGVEAFVEAARHEGALERLKRVKLGAVGPRTADTVRSFGLTVSAEAELATGPGLFEAIHEDLQPGDEVLLPVAETARPELQALLLEKGVDVTRVVAYRATQVEPDDEAFALLESSPPTSIVLASPRTVEALIATGTGRAIAARARRIAIGPTTAKALEDAGLAPTAVAEQPTPEGLVEALVTSRVH